MKHHFRVLAQTSIYGHFVHPTNKREIPKNMPDDAQKHACREAVKTSTDQLVYIYMKVVLVNRINP